MDNFIEEFQQHINLITEEYNQISEESSVQEITSFETHIGEFNSFLIQSIKNKQHKAVINSQENAAIISDLIRTILTQKYRNIIASIFAVIQTVSFQKSAIVKHLHDSGAMALMAIHIEIKNYIDFMKLTDYLKQMAETNTQYFNLSLINAILSQLTSIKKEFRLQCYRFIQVLLIKGTPYFYQMYELIVANSITPDLIEDIPDVVFILSCFYQEQQYIQRLIDDKLLFQHLTVFIHQEEVVEHQQQGRQKKVNYEKPEVILQHIEEIKQKLTLLEISLNDVEKQINILTEVLEKKKHNMTHTKQQLAVDQKLLQEAQVLLNSKTNASDVDQQTFMQDYQLKQRRFIATENAYIQLSQDMENIQNKLKIKHQEQKQYKEQKSSHIKQLEFNEQKYQTVKEGQKQNTLYSVDSVQLHNSLHQNLSSQQIFRSQLTCEKQQYYDYKKQTCSKISAKVEYMKLFMVVLIKNVETMQYITESQYGLQYLFTQLCNQEFCPESFAFYDFLADALLLSIESRNHYYKKVVNRSFSDHFDHDYNTWFSTAQQTMIQTENDVYTSMVSVNDTLRFFVADHNITQRFSRYIDVGFNGFYLNESQTIVYLTIVLNKLYKLGIIEFLFLQLCTTDPMTQDIAMHFLTEFQTKTQFLAPQIYQEIQKTSLLSVTPLERVSFQEDNTVMNQRINLLDKQKILQLRELISTHVINTTTQYQEFNVDFIPRNLVNQKLVKLRILNQSIQKLIDGTQIFKCDCPVLWNWECINDLIQQQGEVLTSEDPIFVQFINKILGFLTGSLQLSSGVYNTINALANIQLVTPFNELKEADDEILSFISNANKQTCLFSLPKNYYSVRICMICYEFIKNLIVSKNGCEILRRSKLAQTLLKYQNKCVKLLTKDSNYNIQDLSLSSFTFSMLFTYYEESMEILIDEGVIEMLMQCVYNHQMHRIQKVVLHTISISTQHIDSSQVLTEIKHNRRQKCKSGHNCCASQNHDDQLCILLNSAMSTTDLAIRYLYVFHLGVLLKKRKYLLQKYQKGRCRCLCKNCVAGKWTNFQILTPEAERHVLESLTCMIRDVQPEIGVLAIYIIEEFAENSDEILSRQILNNLKGWGVRFRLMHGVLLRNEDIIKDLSDEDIESFYNPQQMYIFWHNTEFRQFFQMSGCSSKHIKDCMYDRVKAQCVESSLFEDYFENIEDYAQQNVVVPHHTNIGRTAIGIIEDFSNHQILGKVLYNKVSMINYLCTTLSNTQFYNRITRLISISLSFEGGKRILSSKIIQFLIEKLRDKREQGRIAYRAAMYHIAQISLNPLVQQGIPNDVYLIFDELATSSHNAKTKFLAFNCITIMKENPVLDCLFSGLGWIIYQWEAQGQIGHACYKLLDDNQTDDQINNPYLQFLDKKEYATKIKSVYSYNFEQKTQNPFSLENNLSKDIQQYIDVDINPRSDRKNYFDSKKQQLSNADMFPDISEYRHTHRAIINMGEELGVLSLSTHQFKTLVDNYMFTRKQWPFIKDLVREELATDFIYSVQRIIQSIPDESLQFVTFKQRNNFQDADLAFFDALFSITSNDQITRQSGATIINEIYNKQIQVNPLVKVVAMYVLSLYNISSEHRTIISQLSTPDQGVLEILDQLANLPQNIEQNGFM